MGEFDLIRRYFTRTDAQPGVAVGIGDDCAALVPTPGHHWLISSDMLVEGRHFLPTVDPAALGHKALAVNLSDLAACGATPRGFTLALALPRVDEVWLTGFSRGLFALADAHACPLVGGDTTQGPLNICITVFGEAPAGQMLRRDGARPGDEIWVSGRLGDARLALEAFRGRVSSASLDGTVKLWDTSSGRQIWANSHPNGAVAVAISPDGGLVATGGRDKNVRLWDSGTGKLLHLLSGHTGEVLSLTFSPDGKTLASGSGLLATAMEANAQLSKQPINDGIKLWNVASGKELKTLDERIDGEYNQGIGSLAFNRDGNVLASASGSRVKLWNVSSGKAFSILEGQSNSFTSAAIHPNKRLVSTGIIDPQESVKLWDFGAGELKYSFLHEGAVWANTFSPDGQILVSGGTDQTIKFWDMFSSKWLFTLTEPSFGIRSLAFSPDGHILASAAGLPEGVVPKEWNKNLIVLWNPLERSELKTLSGHSSFVKSVAFSPDGKILASGGWDSLVKLWDVGTGKELMTLKGHSRSVQEVVFDPQGIMLASAGDEGTIRLWSAADGKLLRVLEGHNSNVFTIAFSLDGQTLTGGFGDGMIILWDKNTGQVKARLPGHSNAITSLRYGISDNVLLSSSLDGTVKLWNTETQEEICSLIISGRNNWVVTARDGRFDTDNLDEIRGLQWVMPDESMRALPPEIFMRDYYEPRLIPRLLAGEKLKPVRDLLSLNRVQPRLSPPSVSAPDEKGQVTVSFEVANYKSENQRDQSGKPLESGVYDVRLFRDGQLVDYTTKDDNKVPATIDASDEKSLMAWRKANEVALINGKKTLSFRVTLPQEAGKQSVEFTAYAFNADRVKSETVRTEYKLPTTLTAKPKRAYVVTFGVNVNDNPNWKLHYAANDARLVASDLASKLQASGDYDQVISVPLLSDNFLANGRRIEQRDATKANLKAAFDLLAGRSLSSNKPIPLQLRQLIKATPNDLVIFAFASHGYTDNNGVFYLVPQDTGTASSGEIASVLNRCVSSDELSSWLRDVDAGEMVMIVDACHSAAAVQGQGFKPGPMGSRGLGQLSYDKRLRILAATQADNVALEMSKLEHGLLTYALLEDGLRQKQADYKPKDNRIELGEWLRYGMERVPKLYDEYQAGKRTMLIGGRTSKLAGNINQKFTSIQQPALFDFAKKRDDIILVK